VYDSLTLFVPVDDPARLVSNLENVEERHIQRTGEVIMTGRCGGLYVKTSGSGITVNGSLSRYWLGSNFMAPTFNDCREALHRLEEELGSSLAAMPVYRIDVSATLNLKHPCLRYLKMFGNLPRYKRLERNGGLLYKTKRRELDFYDKKAEARRRKEAGPPCFNGRNALRYELRYRNQLKEQLGEKVTAQRLIEPDFYREIVRRWEQAYHAVHKQARTVIAQMDTASPKRFGASLERLAVEHLGGEVAVLEELRIRRDAGEIDRLIYSRLQTRVARLCRTDAGGTEELIEELDTAICLEVERQTDR
jgi:hypothetical protein